MLLIRLLVLLLLTGCAAGKLDAERAFKLHDRAEMLYQQGEYQSALPLFQQLTRQFPREPEFHLRVGNCYAFENQYDQAVSAYERALDENPRLSRAWYNLSYVRAQILAATVTRMYKNLDPADPDALRMKKLVIAVLEPFGSELTLQLPQTSVEVEQPGEDSSPAVPESGSAVTETVLP